MPNWYTCPRGHRWKADESALAMTMTSVGCPACGAVGYPANAPESLSAPTLAKDGDDPCVAKPPVPAAASLALPVLPTISGYEILGELGRGGMGVVYKARHTKLNRIVALKMILAGSHAGATELARFQTEAQAIARLQHPNIVQVHEVGEHEGKPFFSLEFCGGGGLDKKLNATPLPPREAAALLETLARAMQAAHEQHVIHRDLKPANVLLADDGTPKITDFGLAKKLDEAGQTQSGAIMGTPSYMAPEQAGGKSGSIGPATDVYALGAILYECLTGRPPFKSATALDTLVQVVRDEPVPPRQLQSQTPRDLETICLKCLHKDPARRYRSAAALADDLRAFQEDRPIQARPASLLERGRKWVKRRPTLAALLLVTVLGVAGIVWKYLDAEQQKGIAQRKETAAQHEADKAKKARDFLVRIFELSDANGQRGTMTARQILDDAEERIPTEFADQPELQADLLAAIEGVFAKITVKAPLAMLLEVRGTVQLQSTKNPNARAVPQTLLYAGDRLTLAADADVRLLVLSDLHQERLRPGMEATVRRKGCEPAGAISARSEDVLMTFVRLPKGTFYMGWDGAHIGDDGKMTPLKNGVKTEIKEDFEIAVHDVTQGQWQAVMGENPSSFSRYGAGRNEVKDISDEELMLFPVESVSWHDVQQFIKKLNEKKRGSGFLYRLPSEAEWEFACRGGAASEDECSYHFYFDKPTNDLSSEQANFNGDSPFGKAPEGKDLGRPTRVGAYPPNKLGLCDMHGNVWQWCADPFFPGASVRVFRGGSWIYEGVLCRAAYRRPAPSQRNYDVGFRLARVPSSSQLAR